MAMSEMGVYGNPWIFIYLFMDLILGRTPPISWGCGRCTTYCIIKTIKT